MVDTHYLLWALIEPTRLSRTARRVLTDVEAIKYVSKISFWEIALKSSLGKLTLEGTTPEGILRAARRAGFKVLDIAEDDLVTSHLLPFAENHRDPFDRLLVWQCIRNDFLLLTADSRLRGYEQHGLRIAM